MTRNEIKQISIRAYLDKMNIRPVKHYNYYGMYHCPYRQERNASFKVDYHKNVWHDFGTGEGGSLIDLVMKIQNCTFYAAAKKLEKEYGGVQISDSGNSFSFHGNIASLTIQKIIPITHPKLTDWVQERKIALDLANRYCSEIHYQNKDKVYFSIGFRNDKGGYELSSPPDFKGCISPKDITTIRNNSDRCLVFEGFWDFLSYLTIQKIERTHNDTVILNSVANVQKAMDFLQAHKEIYTYLDNDKSGQEATELIKSHCVSVNNRSEQYAAYKDLNDFLCQKPTVKQEEKNQNPK